MSLILPPPEPDDHGMGPVLRRQTILRLAYKAAACHQDEFPGEPLDGDWDTEAWSMDRPKWATRPSDWQLYHDALHKEVERLRRGGEWRVF